ncbi:MAG: hypothetical protein RBT65_02685 [Methanolobus sp.]|jgi:hypothetical protein|nr:hypothetical protein [Methanolobus sp.]
MRGYEKIVDIFFYSFLGHEIKEINIMKGFFGKFVFFKRPTDDYASGIVVEL